MEKTKIVTLSPNCIREGKKYV